MENMETATYNTDEIFGVETNPGITESTTETPAVSTVETKAENPTASTTEPTTVQTIAETTAYTGVTAEQFEEYQHNQLVGTGYIIFILAMIFGALVGWGFSKIWRM